MNDLDQKIRTVIRAIGDSSPSAPVLRDPGGSTRPRRVMRPGMAALIGFIVVSGFFVGFALLRGNNPSVETGQIEVLHQVLTYRLEVDLPCEGGAAQQSGGFNEMTIESWADLEGSRFRQQTIYPDGSTRDVVALGHPSSPRESWSRGEPRGNRVECVGEVSTGLLGYDPTDGIGVMMFNGPVRSPGEQGYLELGIKQTGHQVDSLGRATDLYVEEVTGFIGDGESVRIRQTISWYVDSPTGDVVEVVFRTLIDGLADVASITTLASHDTVGVPDDHFDTNGYALIWSEADYSEGVLIEGTEVEPFTSLGPEWIWPGILESGGPQLVGERFAMEVLGWEDATVELDPQAEPGGPVWLTITSGQGVVSALAIPDPAGGWGFYQIGEGGMGLGVGAGATPMLGVVALEGAATAIALIGQESATRAWQFDLKGGASDLSLPDLSFDEIRTAMVLYYDAAGQVLGAVGGQYWP